MSAEARAPRLRGLYAITPEEPDTRKLLDKVAAAIAGGAAAVQYRAKKLSEETRLAQAKRLAGICRAAGVPLIVNDSAELARAAGADGIHLGRDDGEVAGARRLVGRGLVGVSCYDEIERVRAAAAAGADYVAIGSVFASSTKPGAVRAPLALLAEARRASGLPVVAIGGITAANAGEAIAAGADMVAVISAVFDALDVEASARAISGLFMRIQGESDVRAQPRAV
jgi:thiamine-phosphate pyrophosphorylase